MKTYSSNVVTPEDLTRIDEKQDAAIAELRQENSFLKKALVGVFVTNLIVTGAACAWCCFRM